MKKRFLLLVSAVFLGWQLAGCTASTGGSAARSHVLETGQTRSLLPPYPTDGQDGPLPLNLTVSGPVADLDKRDVLQQLGRPVERLTPDLWIYWRYYSAEDAAETGGYDTLVVAFSRGRVSRMRLVKGDDLRAHLAGEWRPFSVAASGR